VDPDLFIVGPGSGRLGPDPYPGLQYRYRVIKDPLLYLFRIINATKIVENMFFNFFLHEPSL
jgi:hypothetical protein